MNTVFDDHLRKPLEGLKDNLLESLKDNLKESYSFQRKVGKHYYEETEKKLKAHDNYIYIILALQVLIFIAAIFCAYTLMMGKNP